MYIKVCSGLPIKSVPDRDNILVVLKVAFRRVQIVSVGSSYCMYALHSILLVAATSYIHMVPLLG